MATKKIEKTQKAVTGPTCTITGCEELWVKRGLCVAHWDLYRPPWENPKA